jgi:hypothetical protein
MAEFMSVVTALHRLVEDDSAPVGARMRALRELPHPSLKMLMRLLVDTKKRKRPIPAKIRALAALRYSEEMHLQNARREMRLAALPHNPSSANPLGISQ